MDTPRRPDLAEQLSGTEFRRWYWLKSELVYLARTLGLRTAGSKQLLSDRIAAALDGAAFPEPPVRPGATSPQLTAPLSATTIIPRGQRCSQVVRAWLEEQVGTTVRFDATMRAFFRDGDGTQTMRDALEHYRRTRDQPAPEIGAQFEFNRFTRAWHATHPGGTRTELLSAWREHRDRPVEQR